MIDSSAVECSLCGVFSSLEPDVGCTAIALFLLSSSRRQRQLRLRAPPSTSTSKLQLPASFDHAKNRPTKAARCVSQTHLTIHIHKQLETPSPAPIPGSLQRRLSSASTSPEPPGTLIPDLVTQPPSGFRGLHSRTRSCETISYTPRASLNSQRQHASAPPDATASPYPQI